MEQSIVFSPDVDDRQLDREVSKIDSRLNETGTISPDVQGGGLGGGGGVGVGGGGGPGLADVSAGIGGVNRTLSSKLPSPVSGVAMGSVMPVALGGAVGLGLASAMTSASARLDSTVGMFGTAMNLFFRPFGDFLGEALRPMANDMISFASEFSNLADEEGLGVAVASMAPKALQGLADKIGSSFVSFASGEWDAADLITVTASVWAASKLLSVGSALSLGAGSLLSKSALLANPLALKAGAVIAVTGAVSLAVDELIDISNTDMDTSEIDHPLASMNNPAFRLGSVVGEGGLDYFFPGNQPGNNPGDVNNDGIDESRFVGNVPGVGAGGSSGAVGATPSGSTGGLSNQDARDLKDKLDQVNRNLSQLKAAMASQSIEVNSETLGRVVSQALNNDYFDTDPLA